MFKLPSALLWPEKAPTVSVALYPGLGFPGRKIITDIKISLGLGPPWFHALPLVFHL
jgi:hypothetical protein